MVINRRDKMKSHLKSLDYHGVVFAAETRGRPSGYVRHTRDLSSPVSRLSRSPSYHRDVRRRSRSLGRHRRTRGRVASSDSNRSSTPPFDRVVKSEVIRSTLPSATGDSSSLSVRGGVVGVVGGPGVVGEVIDRNVASKLVAATERVLKMLPLLNTLKAQVADLQVAVSVLPSVELAVKELKASCVELERKCGVRGTGHVRVNDGSHFSMSDLDRLLQ